MPNAETFKVPPIGEFVREYLGRSQISVDPFARNQRLATWTNDMDLATSADFHMEAETFARMLKERGVVCDLVLFDPPYSPRQIVDCYRSVGLPVGRETSQSARFYRRVRDAVNELLAPGGVVLSFGWHSNGMGKTRDYQIEEVLLVAHGGAHNDTICLAERKCAVSSTRCGES